MPDPDEPAPPPAAGADVVYAWWTSLGRDEQDRLIAEHPPELGNLTGIPAAVRDQINTAVMHDDMNRVDGARYRNAVLTKRGLDHDRGPDPGNPRPVMLWLYDPLAFDGQGRAAIAIGDPDHAEDIAVIVSGAGSSVASGWLHSGHNAAINLYDQAQAAYPSDDLSVIAWMGYDAPDGYRDPRIASPWPAREGGVRLAQDVNGLWTTHAGEMPPHVSVIGHSYGASTVADAFAGSGALANDVILLGSPGTDLAHRADDFPLDGGHVYVGAASSDPVGWIGQSGTVPHGLNEALGYPFGPDAGLGTDPAGDGFGATRFRAEVPGGDRPSFGDHSHYYDLGGDALRSMAHIVTGHSEALAREDLLAEGRRQPHITTPRAINIPGLRSIRLPHIDTRIPGIPAYIDPEAERPTEGTS